MSTRKRKSKSHGQSSGRKLRSGFEAKIRDSLAKRKANYEYESERIAFTEPEKKRNYIPDFIITTRSGAKIYVEAKGRLTMHDRQKMEAVRASRPDLDIRFLLQKDNPIRKGSKTKYSDWCEKKGFQYAVSLSGYIPDEWLEE